MTPELDLDAIPVLPRWANLCGIGFRIQTHEDLIVFVEDTPIFGQTCRLSFTRRCGCWYVESEGAAKVSTIDAAYAIVTKVYGANFEQRNGEYRL